MSQTTLTIVKRAFVGGPWRMRTVEMLAEQTTAPAYPPVNQHWLTGRYELNTKTGAMEWRSLTDDAVGHFYPLPCEEAAKHWTNNPNGVRQVCLKHRRTLEDCEECSQR